MKSRLLKLLLLIPIAMSLMGGCEGPHAVRGGTVYDYVNWVDLRANGSYMVWTVNVHDSVFCTYDKSLKELAERYASEHLWVELTIQSINAGDSDGQFLGQGCDSEAEGIQTYRLTGIKPSEEAKKSLGQ